MLPPPQTIARISSDDGSGVAAPVGRTDTTPASPSTATREPAPSDDGRIDTDHGRHTEGTSDFEEMSARAASDAHDGRAMPEQRRKVRQREGSHEHVAGTRGTHRSELTERMQTPRRDARRDRPPRRVDASSTHDVGHERLPPTGAAPQGRPIARDCALELRGRQAPDEKGRRQEPRVGEERRHASDETDHAARDGGVGDLEVADLSATIRHPPRQQEPRESRRSLPSRGGRRSPDLCGELTRRCTNLLQGGHRIGHAYLVGLGQLAHAERPREDQLVAQGSRVGRHQSGEVLRVGRHTFRHRRRT